MTTNDAIRYVGLDEARGQSGLRLVLLSDVPSPWSDSAKDFFRLKKIPFVAVRYRPSDDAIRQWTGVHNAPVALYNDEPALSHWGDLLALAERLERRRPLIPVDLEGRIRMLGLCHEVMGPLGLVWHTRLMLLDVSLKTGGKCGFPLRLAEFLSRKYGYGQQPIETSHHRVQEILVKLATLRELNRELEPNFILGEQLTALDIYCAAALGVMALLPDEQCPLQPAMRLIFESAAKEIKWAIPETLLAHRNIVRMQLAAQDSVDEYAGHEAVLAVALGRL